MSELVWLKKDLRISDHAPLFKAAQMGPVVCLYVFEEEMLDSPEHDPSHQVFINQSLIQVDQELQKRGGRLVTRRGRIPEVFRDIHQDYPFARLWAHEETGLMWTYQRDLRVHEWCREAGVQFIELTQNGVVRRLKTRDGWAANWKRRMSTKVLPPPERVEGVKISSAGILDLKSLGLPPSQKAEAVPGGEIEAKAMMYSFLRERSTGYQKSISSPNSSWDHCSRLSPYLTWGNLSLRELVNATQARARSLGRRTAWSRDLQAFQERLHWHCHFIQKLEDEPEIEFRNMNLGFNGMREDDFRDDYFEAWKTGRTGYPLVDAVMRCLHLGGWINFRMRAMLVSFASYHLWLHWRKPAVFLARHFLDFEPGIHFSQFQMQSATTGINVPRIYNPLKQQAEQDPQGHFVRKYIPELALVGNAYLLEPYKIPLSEQRKTKCIIGRDYPQPLVEHKLAYAQSKRRLGEWLKKTQVRARGRRVFNKHGSRRKLSNRREAARPNSQLEFPF